MTATVLVLVETVNEYLPILERQGYHLELAPTPAERKAAIFEHGERFSAVLTRGPLGLTAEEMTALPNLKIICVIGAGYEQVDLQAATDEALVRDVPRSDAALRRGEWPRSTRPSLAGKHLGVLGLGAVGMAIAKRAALGFDMSVSYHNRRVRTDVPYTFCATPTELARVSDFLIVATPGGLDTRQLINKQALDALGPNGFLVNIARGSVVATADLISALEHRRIAGAALDVFDHEPEVPDALKHLPNVVLTPHVAGLSPEATRAMVELVGDNLNAFFSGKPVLTPVERPDAQH